MRWTSCGDDRARLFDRDGHHSEDIRRLSTISGRRLPERRETPDRGPDNPDLNPAVFDDDSKREIRSTNFIFQLYDFFGIWAGLSGHCCSLTSALWWGTYAGREG